MLPLLFSVCLILFCWLIFACVFLRSNHFRKKINRLEIVLITSLYYTNRCDHSEIWLILTCLKLIKNEMSRARVFKRKYITRKGFFFFYMSRSKTLAQKNIFYSVVLGFKAERFSLHLTQYAKRYSMKLNLLSHDIYLRVIWI